MLPLPSLIYAWDKITDITCPNYTNDVFLRPELRYVGIGTPVPTTKLDVIGGIKSSDLAGTSGFNIVNTGTDGKLTSLHPPTSIANQYLLNGTGTWGLSNWLASGSNIFSNPSNAKVGIATSVPKEYLQIGNQFTFRGDDYNSIIGHNYYYKDLGSGSYTDAHIISGPSSRLYFGGEGDILLQTATTGNAESAISSWNTGLKITNDGNVSIGTLQHDKLLTVNGDVQFLTSTIGNNHNALQILSGANLPERRGINIPDESGAADFNFFIHEYNPTAAFNFCKRTGDNPNTDVEKLMQIRKDGKVGIGVSETSDWNGDYKLYVRVGIRTEKIKVDVAQTSGWADYVFKPDYKLEPLGSLDSYIKSFGHLPGVPTASDVKKDGIDLAEMQSKLLEKIEELTLYVIELNKQNNELKGKYEYLINK